MDSNGTLHPADLHLHTVSNGAATGWLVVYLVGGILVALLVTLAVLAWSDAVDAHHDRRRARQALRTRHMRAASAARRQAWRDTYDTAVKASEPVRVHAERLDLWA